MSTPGIDPAGDRARPLLLRIFRWLLLALLSGVVGGVLFMLALLCVPAVGPVSDNALYWSIAREAGGGVLSGSDGCRRQRGSTWRCDIWDSGGSGTLDYRVKRIADCWLAVRLSGPSGEGDMARRPTGCVKFRDQARPLDRLL